MCGLDVLGLNWFFSLIFVDLCWLLCWLVLWLCCLDWWWGVCESVCCSVCLLFCCWCGIFLFFVWVVS